jgi:hypothetical protein
MYFQVPTQCVYQMAQRLGLYVDDLILISDNMQFLLATKILFTQRFSMVGHNKIEYILSIHIRQDQLHKQLILSQDKYISDLLI